jgi:uncharacterized protein YeaO (DUF488 family)
MIFTKRVYDSPGDEDGARFLVDRLWPRGIKKEKLVMDGWMKEVSPSPALRTWFNHDPSKWPEFQQRYRQELHARPESWRPILEAARRGNVTLLYSARDTQHNSALILKSFLEEVDHGLLAPPGLSV